MNEELILELEAMIRKLEASGIDTGIDIDRLKEITLSIKNGSGYATMDEIPALINKIQVEIADLRTEVRTGDANLDKTITKGLGELRDAMNKGLGELHIKISNVDTKIQHALREQTNRTIVIMSILLGVVVAAISIVVTVVSLLN